jgi:hypothetical protein
MREESPTATARASDFFIEVAMAEEAVGGMTRSDVTRRTPAIFTP